jgi:hypothetical protein
MATFIHVTSVKQVRGIRNTGIKAHRTRWAEIPVGVYALPVVPDFAQTHQWVREMKYWAGQRIMYGVNFRIPDSTSVWIGRYNQVHRKVTAADAVACFMDGKASLGYEVIIPRSIAAKEIRRIRYMSKLVGWRYRPDAHGMQPCPCDYCRQSTFKARRIREQGGNIRRKRKPDTSFAPTDGSG